MEDFDSTEYYSSAGSMKDLDYRRFNYLLHNAGIFAINARQTFDFEQIRGWWATLRTIYNNWRPYLQKKAQDEMDETFEKIYLLIQEISAKVKRNLAKTMPVIRATKELFDKVEAVDEELLDYKKRLGFGVLGRRVGKG